MKYSKLVFSLVLLLAAAWVRAELGDTNPTGISGQFNGNVTTGGSYDSYTWNATRSVTDIVVPGAVGAYPLAFTRTFNSAPGIYLPSLEQPNRTSARPGHGVIRMSGRSTLSLFRGSMTTQRATLLTIPTAAG